MQSKRSKICNKKKLFVFLIILVYHFLFYFHLDESRRGTKKFGDKCESTDDCSFQGSICDSKKKSCQCIEELKATNHIDKCGRGNVIVL